MFKQQVILRHADITKLSVDAIVTAAKSSLEGSSGGIDGAIHRVGGPDILMECLRIKNEEGLCKVGEVVVTNAGNLPAKYVVHAVGPVWSGGTQNEAKLLENAYWNSMRVAKEYQLNSISFPCISTGVSGYPKPDAAKVALCTVKAFLDKYTNFDIKVFFVCFDASSYRIYHNLIEKLSEMEQQEAE